MTTRESVLIKLLDCGTADLSVLDDIEYDLDNIIDECLGDNDVSLHGILRRVFYQAAGDLCCRFDDKTDEIRESIIKALDEEKDFVANGHMTQEDLEECPEHKQLVKDLELLDNNLLHPDVDMQFYLNYLDTHVSVKHIDFYRRYMEDEVEEVERNMGFEFEEWNNW